jgi:hypothetical protein
LLDSPVSGGSIWCNEYKLVPLALLIKFSIKRILLPELYEYFGLPGWSEKRKEANTIVTKTGDERGEILKQAAGLAAAIQRQDIGQ